jgi:hypothetical protein
MAAVNQQGVMAFEVLDHKQLTPLTPRWKKAVSVSIEAAFNGNHGIASKWMAMGFGLPALYDISDYYNDKTAANASDADWLKAAEVLDGLLEV